MIALPVLLLEIHKLRYEADRAYLQPYVTMSEIFLVAILVLNAYWMLLFLVMDYNVLCKGKVQDIQHPVNSKKAYDKRAGELKQM